MSAEPEGNLERPSFGPSDRLTDMFKACSRDPAEGIRTRLRRMLSVFLQHYRNNAENERTNELADECRHQAGNRYYRILEKIAIKESDRLGISDMSSLLNHELQQSCLVACCLEITVSLVNLPCEIPLIFRLAPYHFIKVIEPVLRAEQLPQIAFSHLTQVEEKILESLAWTSDSPLWEEIRANEGHLPTCQQVTPPNRPKDPNGSDVQPEGNLPGAVSADPDQQPSTSAEKPQRSTSFTVFARKVYMLAERHLTKRFPTLSISDELRVKIWTCFEHSLVNFPHLMEDRHLDQLLMCAIFILAKAINEEIPFKHIVRCYKSQPHISKSVCKDVLISGGSEEDSLSGNNNNEDHSAGIPTPDTPSAHYPAPREEQRGNLFKFFNDVYSPKMSYFANQFAAPVGVGSPPLTPFPMQNRTTPRQLHRNYNIFISPLDRGMTPQESSGPTYTFNSGSSEPLREINDMGSGSVPVRRARVALSMEGEEGPPRRRRRSSNESALFRRLKDVENDRAGPQPDLH